MAFRKAKSEQAFLKATIYGPPGSGKTFSTLLFAEGLAKLSEKRIAFVDTERGTDFYAQSVPERSAHPDAFDFDAIYTRSITEINKELRSLKPAEHGVICIDSITHIWEACKASYNGPKTKIGTLPMHAWGKIKQPYKQLMEFLINGPFHVFILGRQGNEFTEDEETGETKSVGVKMKAEGETAYEPHICFRMESVKPTHPKRKNEVVKSGGSIPIMFVEKDRTGILQGKLIELPNFDKVCRPLLGLLGDKQAQVQTEDEAAAQDADALAADEREKARHSREVAERFVAKFHLCETLAEAEALGKTITAAVKKEMLSADVTTVRNAYLQTTQKFKGQAPVEPEPSEGQT
ncbi:MAG: AAA family ATPase [Gemmataceae bacterium]